MANKKVSQLVSKPSVLVTDLFPIADPTTGQLFKTTISALGTAIGSGVSSVNTLVGAVVLDTDDIQELASPTNRWYTDTRSRAAISGGTGISYNSGTGVITNAVTSGQIATALGYTPADDSLVVKLAGSQTITGTKTFQQAPLVDIGVGFKNSNGVYNTMQSLVTGWQMPVNGNNHNLIFSTTTNYVYTFPNASGTIALTSDLSNYVALTGNQTIAGIKTFSDGTYHEYGLLLKHGTSTNAPGYTGIAGTSSGIKIGVGTPFHSNLVFSTSAIYTYTFPSVTGTLALTSDLSAYLPLSGGTLTGALSGTSASFSSSVTSSGYYLTGMTSGSGALYYNSGANRVTIANYNTSGIVTFEVNGGNTALTLNSNSSATFASTLSATGATLTGALGGTTADFSGQVTSTTNFYTAATSNTLGARTFGGNSFSIRNGVSDDFNIDIFNRTSIAWYNALKITNSTGAATFSGSITSDQTDGGVIFTKTAGASTGLITNTFQILGSGSKTDLNAFVYGANQFGVWTNGSQKLTVTSAGNVGIGTTAPGARLEVTTPTTGTEAENIRLEMNTGAIPASSGLNFRFGSVNGATIYGVGENGSTGASSMRFYTHNGTSSAERMRITSGGVVQVNNSMILAGGGSNGVISIGDTTTASNGIYINTQTFTHRFAKFSFQGNPMGEIFYNGINTTYAVSGSDFRLKKNIDKWDENVLDLFKDINPKLFNWNFQNDSDTKSKGFIAQEMTSKFPEAYHLGSDNMYLYNPSGMVVYLIKAVQELEAKIKTLETK
jgi:hypothetical protein